MGKMGKKSGKKAHSDRWGRWGLHFGSHEPRDRSRSSSSSSSSSDSDGGHKHKKKIKKCLKKQWKQMYKLGALGHRSAHLGHHWPHMKESDLITNRAVCALCRHQIQPLVETEVLECGHIYHRLCLKGLFELALLHSKDQLQVMCSQCRQQISENLINEFKVRSEGQPTGGQPQVMELNL